MPYLLVTYAPRRFSAFSAATTLTFWELADFSAVSVIHPLEGSCDLVFPVTPGHNDPLERALCTVNIRTTVRKRGN